MTRRNGEVAVKRDGHVHAVATPELSGSISVDVDAEHVTLPAEVDVSFADPDQGDDRPAEAETDGGEPVARSEVEVRGGLGMSEEQSGWAMAAAAVALLVAGYLWGISNEFAAVAVAAAAAFLGWFGINSLVRWREVAQR
jgi:hypothetical protein